MHDPLYRPMFTALEGGAEELDHGTADQERWERPDDGHLHWGVGETLATDHLVDVRRPIPSGPR